MLDIFVQFNTGFYSQGKLINLRKKIIVNYIKSWFLIDLVASFPYNWVIQEPPAIESSNETSGLETPED